MRVRGSDVICEKGRGALGMAAIAKGKWTLVFFCGDTKN